MSGHGGSGLRPTLAGLGTAFPPGADQSELWRDFFAAHYCDVRLAERIFRNSGVQRRHAAVSPLTEDISATSTGSRMGRYLTEALPLGRSAVIEALADAQLDPADVGLFAVVSCTGYATPGVDVLLARDLGFAPGTQRLLIGHMGCYAALPGLAAVTDYVVSQRRPAVLLCVEITSLHLQPPTREVSQVVAHALFSDAAAALVLRPASTDATASAGHEVEVLELAAACDPTTADQMTWEVTDQGFRMGLSSRVPDSLADQLPGLAGDLLGRYGLQPADVAGWAVHPGGPRILDVVERELKLPAEALAPSREALRWHGNCSSATVLVVLRALLAAGVPSGGYLMLLAFGPGLTLYGALLRAR